MVEKKPFALDHNERTSVMWTKLLRHWVDQLARLHLELEGNQDEIKTAKLRGRIAQIRIDMRMADQPIMLMNDEVPAAPE